MNPSSQQYTLPVGDCSRLRDDRDGRLKSERGDRDERDERDEREMRGTEIEIGGG